jgi:hypothetical protein
MHTKDVEGSKRSKRFVSLPICVANFKVSSSGEFRSYQHRCSTAHAFINPSSPTHVRINRLCLNSTCASSREIECALLTRPNVTFHCPARAVHSLWRRFKQLPLVLGLSECFCFCLRGWGGLVPHVTYFGNSFRRLHRRGSDSVFAASPRVVAVSKHVTQAHFMSAHPTRLHASVACARTTGCLNGVSHGFGFVIPTELWNESALDTNEAVSVLV